MTRLFMILMCCTLMLSSGFQTALAGGDAPAEGNKESAVLNLKGDPVAASEGWVLINNGALLIDVRSAGEYESGHIEGSLNIPHTDIEALADAIGTDKDRQVVVYCRSGGRSGSAQEQLEKLGFTGVFNATGYDALEATHP